ncbi:hypothetical protein PSP6_500047 [Paraburkholderia tropica]|nr:hypothetical protein PSP6_500047 [Paraburkholderia tropica]
MLRTSAAYSDCCYYSLRTATANFNLFAYCRLQHLLLTACFYYQLLLRQATSTACCNLYCVKQPLLRTATSTA